jgi:hypothetical protein
MLLTGAGSIGTPLSENAAADPHESEMAVIVSSCSPDDGATTIVYGGDCEPRYVFGNAYGLWSSTTLACCVELVCGDVHAQTDAIAMTRRDDARGDSTLLASKDVGRVSTVGVGATWTAAAVLVVLFTVRVELDATGSSATFDEPEYITAGYSYLATHEMRLELWHPPLAFVLAGLAVRMRYDVAFRPDPVAWARAEPRTLARGFVYADGRDATGMIRAARLPFLLLGIATILAIAAWARELWGSRAGLVALALASFDPSLIANAALATPDIALTCFTVVAMYAAWRYTRVRSLTRWLAMCAAVVLAFASKHVGLLLVPMIAIVLVDAAIASRDARRAIGRAALATVASVVAIALVAALCGADVLGACSLVLATMRAQLWHLDHLPLAYLHGDVRRGGWWSYYLVVVALKVPLGTLALVAMSALRRRAGTPLTRATVLAVAVPAVIVVGFITWTWIDLGMRLILPAIPFAIVLAARAATLPGRWRHVAMAALGATILSSAFAVTRELGYFNETARVLGGGDRWLTDANLDWGQDLDRLDRYLRSIDAPPVYLAYYGGGSPTHLGLRHATLDTAVSFPPNADVVDDRSEPDAPCHADRQLVAISRFREQGIIERYRKQYAWLTRLTAIAEIGSSIRVYDVTNDAESHVRLTAILGIDSPAGACERARAIALDPTTAVQFSRTR